MDADLTCPTCRGTGACSHTRCRETRTTSHGCFRCEGTGVRPPTLAEYDALRAERDRYREALEQIADPRCGVFTAEDGIVGIDGGEEHRIARAALDREDT